MKQESDLIVLFIAFQQPAGTGLARAALRRGWPLMHMPTKGRALQEIRRLSPDALVVQVSLAEQESLDLIQRLREGWRQLPVVAVAAAPCDELERCVRAAGVSCYLAGTDADQIEASVMALLKRDAAAASPAPAGGADRQIAPLSHGSLSLDPVRRRGAGLAGRSPSGRVRRYGAA